jgi:hypothetical protein
LAGGDAVAADAASADTPRPEDTPQPASLDAAEPVTIPDVEEEAGVRAFGDGIVSRKPLDEVILEYLVDKARERPPGRARVGAAKSARASRSKG